MITKKRNLRNREKPVLNGPSLKVGVITSCLSLEYKSWSFSRFAYCTVKLFFSKTTGEPSCDPPFPHFSLSYCKSMNTRLKAFESEILVSALNWSQLWIFCIGFLHNFLSVKLLTVWKGEQLTIRQKLVSHF